MPDARLEDTCIIKGLYIFHVYSLINIGIGKAEALGSK